MMRTDSNCYNTPEQRVRLPPPTATTHTLDKSTLSSLPDQHPDHVLCPLLHIAAEVPTHRAVRQPILWSAVASTLVSNQRWRVTTPCKLLVHEQAQANNYLPEWARHFACDLNIWKPLLLARLHPKWLQISVACTPRVRLVRRRVDCTWRKVMVTACTQNSIIC
jgi:hypothetical protein